MYSVGLIFIFITTSSNQITILKRRTFKVKKKEYEENFLKCLQKWKYNKEMKYEII